MNQRAFGIPKTPSKVYEEIRKKVKSLIIQLTNMLQLYGTPANNPFPALLTCQQLMTFHFLDLLNKKPRKKTTPKRPTVSQQGQKTPNHPKIFPHPATWILAPPTAPPTYCLASLLLLLLDLSLQFLYLDLHDSIVLLQGGLGEANTKTESSTSSWGSGFL